MKLATLILFCSLLAFAQPVPTNSAPSQFITNNGTVYRRWSPPQAQVSEKLIELRWNPYTNAWFTVERSTNLVDWVAFTNVEIWRTNLFLPSTNDHEFFRVGASYTP